MATAKKKATKSKELTLTPKQERFCIEYLKTGNASEAYRLSYDVKKMKMGSINVAANELLANPKITHRLDALRAPVAKKAQMTLESHLEDLKVLRNAAVKDKKWSSAIAAEVARGKHSGVAVPEKHEHSGPNGEPIQHRPLSPGEFHDIARQVAADV